MKSLQQYISESRFGRSKVVYGETLNGKDCTFKSDDGKDTFEVKNIKFKGDSLEGEVDGKKINFHMVCGFGRHLDGTTVPMISSGEIMVDTPLSKEYNYNGRLKFNQKYITWE